MLLSHASRDLSPFSSWDKSCWLSTTKIKDQYEGPLLKWHHRPLTASRLQSSDVIGFVVIDFSERQQSRFLHPISQICSVSKCVAADWALTSFLSGKIHQSQNKKSRAVVPLTSCLQWAQHNNRKSVLPVCFLGLIAVSLFLCFTYTHRPIAGKRKAGHCLLHMLRRGGHSSQIQTQGWKEGIVTMQNKQRNLCIYHLILRTDGAVYKHFSI